MASTMAKIDKFRIVEGFVTRNAAYLLCWSKALAVTVSHSSGCRELVWLDFIPMNAAEG